MIIDPSIDSVLMNNEAIDKKDVLQLKQLIKVEDKQVSPTSERDAVVSTIGARRMQHTRVCHQSGAHFLRISLGALQCQSPVASFSAVLECPSTLRLYSKIVLFKCTF